MLLYDRDDGPPQGGDGFFQATEQIDDDDDPATAIRVKLPPSEIEFGLGRSLGADDITVSKAATARLGTPEGAGMLPFAVTVDDLRLGAEKEICVLDPAAEPTLPDPPATDPIFTITDPPIAIYPAPTNGDPLTLRRVPFIGRALPTDNPIVFIDGVARGAPESATPDAIAILLPDLTSGPHRVWVQSDTASTNFSTIFVTGGAAAPPGDSCEGTSRGVLDIGRDGLTNPPNTVLGENLKRGVEPRAHRIFDFPDQINPTLLDPVLDLLRCRVLGLPPLPVILNFLLSTVGVAGVFSPDINCVTTRASGFADGLTVGLLDEDGANPGRLLQPCSDEEAAAGGRDDRRHRPLRGRRPRHRRRAAEPGGPRRGQRERGLIKNDAFRCPRLGMVPVIQPGLLDIVDDDYPIVDFTYVWIDDDADGLIFNPDNIASRRPLPHHRPGLLQPDGHRLAQGRALPRGGVPQGDRPRPRHRRPALITMTFRDRTAAHWRSSCTHGVTAFHACAIPRAQCGPVARRDASDVTFHLRPGRPAGSFDLNHRLHGAAGCATGSADPRRRNG